MPRSSSITDRLPEFPIFLVLAGMLVMGPLWYGGVGLEAFSWICGLSGALIALQGVVLAIRPRKRQLWLPPLFGILLFCLYAYWSYSKADIEYVARLEWLMVLSAACVCFCVVQQLHRQSWIYSIIATLIIVGTGLAALAIIQYITDSRMVLGQPLPKQYWGRGGGSYVCPNHLAGLLEMIIPISLSLGLISRLNAPLKIAIIYASLVMIAGVVVTFSRGSWISLAISLALLIIFLIRRPHLRIAVTAVALLMCGGLYFFSKSSTDIAERIDETTLESGQVDNIRFIIWKPALQIWKENLWTGAGPAHFDYLFPKYRPENFQFRAGRVHNDYLNTLVDFGIIGLALIILPILMLALAFHSIWKANRRDQSVFGEKNSNKEPVFIGCSLGVLAMLIHSFVDFNLHIPANAIVFTVIFGIAVSYWRNSTKRFWFSPTWWMNGVQIIAFCATGFYLIWNAFVLHSSHSLHQQALGSEDVDQRLELLTQAHQIDPDNYKVLTLIGEHHRKISWQGGNNYTDHAKTAIEWLDKTLLANPWHYYAHLRSGMAHDWIYQYQDAQSHFEKALAIDPNGYFTQSHLGWHYLMIDDLLNAKTHLQRSKKLKPTDNSFTDSYLETVNARLNL